MNESPRPVESEAKGPPGPRGPRSLLPARPRADYARIARKHLELLREHRRRGLGAVSDSDVADALGLSPSTVGYVLDLPARGFWEGR